MAAALQTLVLVALGFSMSVLMWWLLTDDDTRGESSPTDRRGP